MKTVNKKGQIAGNLIAGIIGLVFLVVIGLVMVSQLLGANLLSGTDSYTAGNLSANMSAGINTIALKIPTFFTITAAVLILGFVFILWRQYQASKMSSGGAL